MLLVSRLPLVDPICENDDDGDHEHTDPENWEKFNDLMFSVWNVSVTT